MLPCRRVHRRLRDGLRLWHLFSGPYKSLYQSAAGEFPQVVPLAVDWMTEFSPDVVADICSWDFWDMLFDTHRLGDAVLIPHHIHLTPSCQTYGPGAMAHRGNRHLAGLTDSPTAIAADAASRYLAFIVRQFTRAGLPTTFSVENPVGSRFWSLPHILALFADGLLIRTVTDYCCFGGETRKPTVMACSPGLVSSIPPWVLRCDMSGSCGAVTLVGSEVQHTSRTSTTLTDTAVPVGICSALNRTWTAHHSRLRHQDCLSRRRQTVSASSTASSNGLPYAQLSADRTLQLRLEWLLADFSAAAD